MIEEVYFSCPYCWQRISVLVDTSVERQQYVEDCEVCCNPISLSVVAVQGDTPRVEAAELS